MIKIKTGEQISELVSEPDSHYTANRNPHKDVKWVKVIQVEDAIRKAIILSHDIITLLDIFEKEVGFKINKKLQNKEKEND